MKKTAFTILELLVVIVAFSIIVGVVLNVYGVSLDIWNEGFKRSDIRTELSQTLELVTKNLRRATSIDALTDSSITFTADLGSGSTTYRVYLYNAADPEPNPPYTQSTYDLRWVQGTTSYGSGASLANNIIQPSSPVFSQAGNVINVNLTAAEGDETVRLSSSVRPRNL
ncbi:MAG: prepilin-type N-terminal cleavage/methylation domain-containing protein [Candidatus Omnitrophica bacterium]|nr:prepilin-type N-terminal cleavage/methylation domain-containing protein [Candidatus Omnitrophota bacterium]